MKKMITAITLTLTSLSAFASLEGQYKLVNGTSVGNASVICTQELLISKNGANGLTIEGNSNLGMYFNADGTEGMLSINKINLGTVVDNSTGSAHGEKFRTEVMTKLANDKLSLVLSSKTKSFFITTSKSLNTLKLEKSANILTLKSTRSFDETMSSTSDWQASDNCTYQVK